MTKRNDRLEHLLSPRQQIRLRRLWRDFHALLDEVPEDPIAKRIVQAKINRLRAQMPPGGLSWPWWEFILAGEERTPVDLQEVAG